VTIHELKCWPHAFEAIRTGRKTFEVRSDLDRDFEVDDTLLLRKWDPGAGRCGAYIRADGYSWQDPERAESLKVRVTYILHGGRFGLPAGICVMAIKLEEQQ
jgi:hypothetical protein